MSKNCLVTKLKSVVANDNLLKVGELRYKFTTADQMELLNRQVGREQYPIVIVPIKGNIYFGRTTKPAEPLTTPYTVTHNLDNGYGIMYNLWWDADSEFSIENYYDIAIGAVPASAFTYLNQENGMYKISLGSGNLSDIDLNKTYSAKQILNIKLNTKGGNILDFYKCLPQATRIESALTLDVSYTMKQLGDALNTVITIFYGPNISGGNPYFGITGQIEDFVAMQKIKGRNEATINMGNMYYPEVTFNDSSIGWGSSNLVWSTDGDNTSITYAGRSTVISISADGTWTRVS